MIWMIQEIMRLKKRIKELKKQNERLIVEREDLLVNLLKQDEELQALKEEHKKCTRKHWQSKCAEHCTNEMIYKSRLDKAIEYNQKIYDTSTENERLMAKINLDILRGEYNE